jgi:hypothetical protein
MEDIEVAMRREAGGILRVHVSGEASLESAIGYWRRIAAEIARDPPLYLLLVDELVGPALTPAEWAALVDELADRGLAGVRIAHVKPRGLEAIEHCEIAATQAGMQARVFVDETLASVWLRYGMRE